MAPVLSRCGQPEVGEDFAVLCRSARSADAAAADIAVRRRTGDAGRGSSPCSTGRRRSATWPEVDHPTLGRRGRRTGPRSGRHRGVLCRSRTMLVREQPDGLALCTVVPDTWLGQSWEAQGLPTAEGRLGFAVRWHGDRPALLWELEPHPDVERRGDHRPGLDPTWSSVDARGRGVARSRGPARPIPPTPAALLGHHRRSHDRVDRADRRPRPQPAPRNRWICATSSSTSGCRRRHRPRRGGRHARAARARADRVARRTALRPGRGGGAVRASTPTRSARYWRALGFPDPRPARSSSPRPTSRC